MTKKYRYTSNYIKEYKDVVPVELATRIINKKDLAFYEKVMAPEKQAV